MIPPPVSGPLRLSESQSSPSGYDGKIEDHFFFQESIIFTATSKRRFSIAHDRGLGNIAGSS